MSLNPPRNDQKRYKGVVRANMRSSLNHLVNLLNYDVRQRQKPCTTYPQQLAPPNDVGQIAATIVLLQQWLEAKGPVPTRQGCPTT